MYGKGDTRLLLKMYFKAVAQKMWTLAQMSMGVWTEETITAMEVKSLAAKYGGTKDAGKIHQEVIEQIGVWHSLFWQFAPLTLVVSKLGEAANEPPLFVYDGPLHLHISDVQERMWAWGFNMARFTTTILLLAVQDESIIWIRVALVMLNEWRVRGLITKTQSSFPTLLFDLPRSHDMTLPRRSCRSALFTRRQSRLFRGSCACLPRSRLRSSACGRFTRPWDERRGKGLIELTTITPVTPRSIRGWWRN